MKKFTSRLVFSAYLIFSLLKTGHAQGVSGDSIAINHSVAYFDHAIGDQSRLYNGAEYQPASPTITGNAFFQDNNTWRQGAVRYDGILYSNVPMMYDLYGDWVVVLLYNKFSKYSLVSEKVHDFYLADHHFVRIGPDSAGTGTSTELKPGFYDQLYSGKIKVLVKRSKSIQTNTFSENRIENYYLPKTEYYIKKNGAYYSFGGEGSMLSILKDHKKELQQYLKSNKIRFKDNPEQSMITIATNYDLLTR